VLGVCVACAQPADAAQSQMAQQPQIIPHFAKSSFTHVEKHW
jgi:hypothetical protein